MSKKIAITVGGILLITSSLTLLYLNQDNKENLFIAHGNVDIRQSNLSFEQSGKIDNLLKDEGDNVEKGEILAKLDTHALDYEIEIKQSHCEIAKLNYEKADKGYRKEEIEQAKANVDRVEQSYKLAKISSDRYDKLYSKKSASEQDKDNAHYKMEELKAQLQEAKANYEMLLQGVRIEDLKSAKANATQCENELEYLKYKKEEQSIIRAPFNGVIRIRHHEIGDYVTPNSTVFELSMIKEKRVRVYLSERQLANIKLSQNATIKTANKQNITGKVAYISNTAMFTPKTVQTENLRADLVYEVRIDATDQSDVLRLGQPVSVEFSNE